MKSLNFLIFFLILNYSSIAQVSVRDRSSGNPLDQFTWSNLTDKTRSFGQPSNDYDGTPYFLDEWKVASLQTIDNRNYLKIELKIDIYNKRLLFKDRISGDSTVIVDEYVREFILEDGDTIYHFQKVLTSKMKNYKAFDFYLVLVDGPFALLLKPEKRLITESISNGLANRSGTMRDEYKDLTSYFIYSRNERKLNKIKTNLKSIIKAVGSNQTEMEKFVDENNLNLNKKENLIKVMAYYNSII